MKLECINPQHIFEATLVALNDLISYNKDERDALLERYRYHTVTGFLGRNPRQVKRTDEEIESCHDIEFSIMEHHQEQRERIIKTLHSASALSINIGAKMSLTTEEFIILRRYFS